MSGSDVSTDFSTWSLDRLAEQKKHLESILPMLNERDDPEKPQMRAELKAIREEIARGTAGPAQAILAQDECDGADREP